VFEPLELTVLARQLVVGSLDARFGGLGASYECRLRSALGRAYYGLYLSTRALIVRRHGVPSRMVTHGLLHTKLRHSRAGREVQVLGHEMRRLYALRQQAEMAPTAEWQQKLTDPVFVDFIVKQAIATVSTLERLTSARSRPDPRLTGLCPGAAPPPTPASGTPNPAAWDRLSIATSAEMERRWPLCAVPCTARPERIRFPVAPRNTFLRFATP
jgi:hypothetical protein